ncbi:transposase [Rhizosaccharibacter radicis]|uniref:transposase n=1 Tax=Rhizosaccharibacter radicis TaxID=2782605 RepID=UPI003BF4CC13
MRRVNHSEAVSLDGGCIAQVESHSSRFGRTEMGQHHHISGKYLLAYAAETGWREDNRRLANGALHLAATSAARGIRRRGCGRGVCSGKIGRPLFGNENLPTLARWHTSFS